MIRFLQIKKVSLSTYYYFINILSDHESSPPVKEISPYACWTGSSMTRGEKLKKQGIECMKIFPFNQIVRDTRLACIEDIHRYMDKEINSDLKESLQLELLRELKEIVNSAKHKRSPGDDQSSSSQKERRSRHHKPSRQGHYYHKMLF
ncbi:MAG: hypothetical protein EZS28_017709 [Streblomastix strix]|uniref:Uncharacterized protein n=1 Tax=Streblomastix strix TaxID=222440 RepID=A0A5J4VVX2_9EUKA|nr:MAG: hypothetical protein EZS28_017709 [Streblomastix strix]